MAVTSTLSEVDSTLAGLIAAVDGFCDRFDPAVLSGEQAAQAVTDLARMTRRLHAVTATAAGRAVECRVWQRTQYHDGPSWYAAQLGCSLAHAHSVLRTVERLDACPQTSEALAAGELSLDEAEVVTAAVTVAPGSEAELVAKATSQHNLAQTRERANRIRQAARSEEDEAARVARLRAKRRWHEFSDDDGLTGIAARLVPTDFAEIKPVLDAYQQAAYEAERRTGTFSSPAAHRADGFLHMARAAATAVGLTPTAPATVDDPTDRPDPSGASGASGAAEPASAGRRSDATEALRLPPPAVPAKIKWDAVILVDATALTRGHTMPGERCEIPGVGPVSAPWVKQLLGERSFEILVHNGVDILTYASSTRYTPRPVKLAVGVRDNLTCVIGDCGRRRVERDHRDPFAETHDTSYPNLHLLCEVHHDQKTHQGARLERHGNEWWWYPPPPPPGADGAPAPPVEPIRSPVGDTLTTWHPDHLPPPNRASRQDAGDGAEPAGRAARVAPERTSPDASVSEHAGRAPVTGPVKRTHEPPSPPRADPPTLFGDAA